jgi:alkane 1-monooxygenase
VIGRAVLFELSRHSDHHFKADRPYQLVETSDDSPVMPTGYPGMMVLAFIPPLFFKVMNHRVNKALA